MAAVYSMDGHTITEGLQGCKVCDEALAAAFRIAADRGEDVILEDDDGHWRVPTEGGEATALDRDTLVDWGMAEPYQVGDRVEVEVVERDQLGMTGYREGNIIAVDCDDITVLLDAIDPDEETRVRTDMHLFDRPYDTVSAAIIGNGCSGYNHALNMATDDLQATLDEEGEAIWEPEDGAAVRFWRHVEDDDSRTVTTRPSRCSVID